MNRYNVNVLAEAKKEYTAQLVNTITPEVYVGIKSMYTAASEFCKRTNEKNVLIKFQTLLAKTPGWNQEKIENEFGRIEKSTNCDYLPDLLTAIFVSHTKVLASLKMKKNTQSFELDVPNGSHFIHKVYIECARKFWKYPYLLHSEFSNLDLQRNLLQAENFIKECIEETIRKLLPVRYVLKECLGDDYNDDDDVEEDIKSSISHNTKDNIRKLVKFEIEQTLSRQSNSDDKFSKVEIKDDNEQVNSEIENLIVNSNNTSENDEKELEGGATGIPDKIENSEDLVKDTQIMLDRTDEEQILDVTNGIIKQISMESLENIDIPEVNEQKNDKQGEQEKDEQDEDIEDSDINDEMETVNTDDTLMLLEDQETLNNDNVDEDSNKVSIEKVSDKLVNNQLEAKTEAKTDIKEVIIKLEDTKLNEEANTSLENSIPKVVNTALVSKVENEIKNIDLIISEKIEQSQTKKQVTPSGNKKLLNKETTDIPKKIDNSKSLEKTETVSLSKLQSLEDIRNEINNDIIENSNDAETESNDDDGFSFFDDAANF